MPILQTLSTLTYKAAGDQALLRAIYHIFTTSRRLHDLANFQKRMISTNTEEGVDISKTIFF